MSVNGYRWKGRQVGHPEYSLTGGSARPVQTADLVCLRTVVCRCFGTVNIGVGPELEHD